MAKSFLEEFVEKSPRNMRRFQQEQSISEATGLIEKVMGDSGVNRTELARLLGKSKGFVTQLLDGEANKTVRTVADVFAVLGCELHFKVAPINIAGTAPQVCSSWEETVRPLSQPLQVSRFVIDPNIHAQFNLPIDDFAVFGTKKVATSPAITGPNPSGR